MQEQLNLEELEHIERMKNMLTPTEEEFEEYLNLYREAIRYAWVSANLIEQILDEKHSLKRYKAKYGVELTKEQKEKESRLKSEILDLDMSIGVLQDRVEKFKKEVNGE